MDVAEIPAPPESLAPDRVPLVVDLDGTLLRTDSLIESIFVLARTRPLRLFKLPLWCVHGIAGFKHRLAAAALPDVHFLPYRPDLMEFLREQKGRGRRLILATGADERLAREVGQEVGLFEEVLASDGQINLSGARKRDRLVAEFGLRGFDYVGNSAGDYLVWSAARRALLVSPTPRLARKVGKVTPVERSFSEPGSRWLDYLHALRPHHWVKNGLVFMPLALTPRLLEVNLFGRAALAFAAFSLCASGQYLLNDLLDLPADRHHPHKKERRLASGRISLARALLLMPLLLMGAFAVAWHLSAALAGVLAVYLLLMIGYSVKLKDIPMVDALVLSIGYALRVAAGALAIGIKASAWLLTFCVFLFFSLALIKRHSELVAMGPEPGLVHARGYLGVDEVILAAQGIASGYLAVLVLALYTNTEISHRLYARHDFFWGICLLLMYWVSYLWIMANRGRIRNDPVIFALSDPVSLGTIAAMAALAVLAL
ncbi:MAG: UbiA family prenyltransferase [Steroidobacteraceae bacterium]